MSVSCGVVRATRVPARPRRRAARRSAFRDAALPGAWRAGRRRRSRPESARNPPRSGLGSGLRGGFRAGPRRGPGSSGPPGEPGAAPQGRAGTRARVPGHVSAGRSAGLSAELSARTSGSHVRFVSTGTHSWSRTNRTDKFFPIGCPLVRTRRFSSAIRQPWCASVRLCPPRGSPAIHPRAPRAPGRQAVTFAGSAAHCARHRQTSTLSRMLAWQPERDSSAFVHRASAGSCRDPRRTGPCSRDARPATCPR
jgi:hypothetical protein